MALADGEEPPVLPIRDPGLVARVVNERHFRYRAEVSSELSPPVFQLRSARGKFDPAISIRI